MGGHSVVRVNRVECNQVEADVGTQVRRTRLKLGKAQIVRVHLCMLKYMLSYIRSREEEREIEEREKSDKEKGERVSSVTKV